MATYFTNDFADFSGTSPNFGDWTARYRNDTGGWTLSSGDIQATSGAPTADWIALTWNDVDGDADRDNADVLVVWRTNSFASRQYNIIVRASGADESATHYSLAFTLTTIRLYYCSATDTPTQVTSASATISISTNTDYWCRIRVQGSSLKAKIWSGVAGDEPGGVATDASWNLSVTDSNVTAAGWVGCSHYSSATSYPIWKQIGVGTNGDWGPASAPSTAASFAFHRAFPRAILNF